MNEIRTVISDDKLRSLVTYFDSKASKKEQVNEVIYNYHTENDFRLIRTKDYVLLDCKTNKEENTIYVSKKYEKDLIKLFQNIGTSIEFKRFRNRYKYLYEGLYITIDKNIKTGNILRVKFDYKDEEELNQKTNQVNDLFKFLDIEETSLDRFSEIYAKYRTSWDDLTKDIDEEEFLK